ncbi:MAG: TRAP transporter substrate-binding protein DctP [Zestosphaera sp.]
MTRLPYSSGTGWLRTQSWRWAPVFQDLRERRTTPCTYTVLQDILRKHIEARGVLLVGPLDIVPSEVLVSRVPIRTLDDIKGKIIRTAGLSAKIYEKLGAKVVTLTAGEIYQALQLGTIDALEWGDYEADYILGYHEVAKYVLEAPPGYSLHSGAYPDSILILNPNSWNNLPDDLKEIVKGAAKAAYTWGIERTYSMAELRGRQLWENAGAEITVLSPEECKKIISVSMDIYVGLAKQHADAKDFIVRLAKAWNDLGYAE